MMPPVIQANAGQSIGRRASASSSTPRKPPVKTSRARRAPSTSRPAPTMRGTTPGPTCAYPPPVGRWNEPQRTAPPRASTPAATATCPAGAFTCRLLLGERERGQDVSQALVLLLDVLAVGVAGQPEVAPVLFLERLLPGGALHALLHRGDELVALRLADSGRGEDPAPVGELDVDALLLERRDPLERLGRGHGERAHLARLDVRGELRQTRDAGAHVPADDRRDRLAAALEGHVVHLAGLDTERLGDHSREDVVGAAGAAAAPRDAAWIRLELVEQLLQRLRAVRRHA